MSQQSEERVNDPGVQTNVKGRVIPFERPQSELQKAVQQRAQEAIERERERASHGPPAWRRALVLALAVVPVVVTFGAAIGFVGALRQFNSAVFESSKESREQTLPAATPSQGAADVVILQPYDDASQSGGAGKPPVSPAPR